MIAAPSVVGIVGGLTAAAAVAAIVSYVLIDAAYELVADLAAKRHYATVSKEG